jgi:hypothetical protein
MDWLNQLDWAAVTRVLTENRVALEVLGLVFGSFLVGFLVARWLYKGQVTSRSEILRREFAGWRRRLAQGHSRVQRVKQDKEVAYRKLRKARA